MARRWAIAGLVYAALVPSLSGASAVQRSAKPAVTQAMVARDLVYGCAPQLRSAMTYLTGPGAWSPVGARSKLANFLAMEAGGYLEYRQRGLRDYGWFAKRAPMVGDTLAKGGDPRWEQWVLCLDGRIDAHLKGLPFLTHLPQ